MPTGITIKWNKRPESYIELSEAEAIIASKKLHVADESNVTKITELDAGTLFFYSGGDFRPREKGVSLHGDDALVTLTPLEGHFEEVTDIKVRRLKK